MTVVAVGMSGGLDSSVVAHRLSRASGLEIFGFTMRIGHYEAAHERTCCSLEDLNAARSLCDRLGISHYTIDVEKQFGRSVVKPFVDDYLSGQTPNPCSICNREIKMGYLVDKLSRIGADFIATGHYVRRVGNAGPLKFLRGNDKLKDQSYYLGLVNKKNLSRFLFPVGYWTKEKVREYAEKNKIPALSKRESQSLCFVPDREYRQYILQNTSYEPVPGKIRYIDGRVVGQHKGYVNYTVGQRRGLGVAHPEPLYVLKIDPAGNELIVGEKKCLEQKYFEVKNINWLADETAECKVQVRYNGQPLHCRLEDRGEVTAVLLEKYARAISVGQTAVFYSGDRLLGAARIACAPMAFETDDD